MKVLKFGGTSVGSVESLLNVKEIVCSRKENCIVVVSALGGITNLLLETAEMACHGDLGYRDNFERIRKRHHDVIDGLFKGIEKDELLSGTDDILSSLLTLYEGVFTLKVLPAKTSREIVSCGERISSRIVNALVEGSELLDSRNFIKTIELDGRTVLDAELTESLVRKTFADFSRKGRTAIVPGFISADSATEETTNLGRGGSDYTASIIAAALDAECLEIWTDVDGFLTADPRIIKEASVIEELSFAEAMELCNFGAKVIYPPALYPVCPKDIPILIKNTFNPSAKGTVIRQNGCGSIRRVAGISSIDNSCILTVSGASMAGIVGVDSRIFSALAMHNISVFMVSQSSSETHISLGVMEDVADLARKVLEKEFAHEIAEGSMSPVQLLKGLATVAIVGEKMKSDLNLAGKVFSVLGRNGIDVIACAQGTEKRNISFVVEKSYLKKALEATHDEFFLESDKRINIFVAGYGNVGKALIKLISKNRKGIFERTGKNLVISGLSNSRRFVTDTHGLDISNPSSLLESGSDASEGAYIETITGMHCARSIFVDCTSSSHIASCYGRLMEAGCSIVACNKIAFSVPYCEYKALKDKAVNCGVSLRYETTVGAALPVLESISREVNAGDRILSVEAVLSGTLNYLLSNYAGNDFAGLVNEAHDAGYTEPDPQTDLSGRDVLRKLLILAREAGVELDEKDVIIDPLIQDERKLAEAFRTASSHGCRLRYTASLTLGEKGYEATMGMREIGSDHPFFNLSGTDNCAVIRSEFYPSPLVIQGAGAGAVQTASGILNDILL